MTPTHQVGASLRQLGDRAVQRHDRYSTMTGVAVYDGEAEIGTAKPSPW